MKPETIEKIREHYNHAREKHPYFCDKLTYVKYDTAHSSLIMAREILNDGIKSGFVSFMDILICELFEAEEEMANDNKERAIEELLDVIAVCMRGIDVLEGRQALGDPAKQSTNNNTNN